MDKNIKKKRFIWNERQTRALLRVWEQRNKDLIKEKRQYNICKQMEQELKDLNVYVSAAQIKTKIKSMRTFFRAEKRAFELSGTPSEWNFYNDVQELVKSWPSHMTADEQDSQHKPHFEFCSPDEDSWTSSDEDKEIKSADISSTHYDPPTPTKQTCSLIKKERSNEPIVKVKDTHPPHINHLQDDAQIFGDFIASSIREFTTREQQQQLKRALTRTLLNFQEQQVHQKSFVPPTTIGSTSQSYLQSESSDQWPRIADTTSGGVYLPVHTGFQQQQQQSFVVSSEKRSSFSSLVDSSSKNS